MSYFSRFRESLRFLALWGALAVACFVGAAILTDRITYVSPESKERPKAKLWELQEIGIFVDREIPEDSDLRISVNYIYDEASKTSVVQIASPNVGIPVKIVLNQIAGPDACVDEYFLGKQDTAKRLQLIPLKLPTGYSGSLTRGAYLIELPDWSRQSLHITCELSTDIVERETYTTRHLNVYNLQDPFYSTLDGHELALIEGEPYTLWPNGAHPVKWTLDVSRMNGAADVNFIGAPARLAWAVNFGQVAQFTSTRDMLPGDVVVLRWRSVYRESRRDILIVVIGALIALGAAMLLETLRPFVEAWARSSGQPTPVLRSKDDPRTPEAAAASSAAARKAGKAVKRLSRRSHTPPVPAKDDS